MSAYGIQGQLLEVTVVACSKLKDTEWISRQDPYVCLEYGSSKFRTRTCTDGHKNPTFQEKFVFTLIEGLRELNVVVWNSNTLRYDDFIGSGKVQIHKVLSQGYDDSSWTLQTRNGGYAGEVRLILHYASSHKPAANHQAYMTPQHMYAAHPPNAFSAPLAYPPAAAYPPPQLYPPPPQSGYPPAAYPPAAYPPAAYGSSPYPPSPFPGLYPPTHY